MGEGLNPKPLRPNSLSHRGTGQADNSPLTQADLAADKVIKTGLGKLQLGWPVLTEESAQIDFAERKDWQRFWLVDPLDGTKDCVNWLLDKVQNVPPELGEA